MVAAWGVAESQRREGQGLEAGGVCENEGAGGETSRGPAGRSPRGRAVPARLVQMRGEASGAARRPAGPRPVAGVKTTI